MSSHSQTAQSCDKTVPLPLAIMDRHFFRQTQASSRLLFKRTRRIGHIEPTATITNRKPILQDMLAKFHGHLGIERLHKAVAKNIAGDDVRMARAKNQIAIGVDAGP